MLLGIVFVVIAKNKPSVISAVALTGIFAGGLHNMAQRVMYNCVQDYLDFFGLFSYNIADVFITSGVVLLIFDILTNE